VRAHNSDPVQKFFLRVAGKDGAPKSCFSNFWKCLKRVELDKATSRRYDVTRAQQISAIHISVYCIYSAKLSSSLMLVPVQWLSMDKRK